MLRLKNITKVYVTGDLSVNALDGVNVTFRDNEFVAVLGPSGCGKTTLLNIIGGLDRYTDGDLVINRRSTKEYNDADWDSYRNHSIGFVFQTYNLIPHQTVLANVELALTLSGVGRAERKQRATEALASVGLGDQLSKKPNQLSGGQMQRVAIARALVNNPDILLADEPTGALDTETSVQVMDILREVARDRLVIMVTHNPDLAERYATRIVRLLDGKVIDDSRPVTPEELDAEVGVEKPAKQGKKTKKTKKTSMSFGTAMSLSLNNLMTKKTRTLLTSFAGSIGIIGIALILSMSSGFQNYIDRVQQDTLSTYPLQIEASSIDMTGLLSSMMGGSEGGENNQPAYDDNKIHSVDTAGDMYSALQSQVKNNDLEAFYAYLQTHKDTVEPLTSAIQYRYDLDVNLYNVNSDFGTVRVNPSSIPDALDESYGGLTAFMQPSSFDIFSEMIDNSELLAEQYDVVSGHWPTAYNEVVLVISENNGINVLSLYTLGLLDQSELAEKMAAVSKGEAYEKEDVVLDYADVIFDDKGTDDPSDDTGLSFNLVFNDSYFKENADGSWSDLSDDKSYTDALAANGEQIRVVGIIRPSEASVAGSINGAVAYTHGLTEYVVEKVNASGVVTAQTSKPDTDIFTGLPFSASYSLDTAGAASAFRAAATGFDTAKKAEIMKTVIATNLTDAEKAAIVGQRLSTMTETEIQNLMFENLTALMTDTEKFTAFQTKHGEILAKLNNPSYTLTEADQQQMLPMMIELVGDSLLAESELSEEELAASFDAYLPTATDKVLEELYKKYCLSTATYDENLKLLSAVDESSPTGIYIYPTDFESKEALTDFIAEYNAAQTDENKEITYTDYVGIFISSISTIINTISYVLIGFVSISLVVSSIMIGVITYISVLERTKEIGILRSIGASKHDIRMVFNAETFIIGGVSGLLGIGVTLLLIIPVNLVIKHLSGISGIAALPLLGGVILVVISILLTVVSGLIPSGLAAKRDPVVALRTE